MPENPGDLCGFPTVILDDITDIQQYLEDVPEEQREEQRRIILSLLKSATLAPLPTPWRGDFRFWANWDGGPRVSFTKPVRFP